MRITLRQLQIFGLVAREGTTASAARTLALSQSATSAAINEFERLLGLQVFDRVGKRLQLNDHGRTLLPSALAVLDGAQALERSARERTGSPGALHIGASTTIGNHVLPPLLAEFAADRATVPTALPFQVTIANTAAIAAQVSRFELDFGLVEGPCRGNHLAVRPWCDDVLAVVTAPTDPILHHRRRGKVTLAALRAATWLLREEGSGTREVIDQLLTPHLYRLRPGIEFGTSEAIRQAAAAGLGITCLSRCVVADALRSGALVEPETELPPLVRQFHIVTHELKRPTAGLQALMDYLMSRGTIPAPRVAKVKATTRSRCRAVRTR